MNVPAWLQEWTEILKSWWPLLAVTAMPFVWYLGGLLKHYVKLKRDAANAFVKRLDESMVKVDTMSKALGDNGGSSLADLIRATAKASTMQGARQVAFLDYMDKPMFEADLAGGYTRINKAMVDLLGYSQDDLKGRGWITMVFDEDRERTAREWFHAIADLRSCVIRTRLISRLGLLLDVRVVAQPMDNEVTGEVVAWAGSITLVVATGIGGHG